MMQEENLHVRFFIASFASQTLPQKAIAKMLKKCDNNAAKR